jgi:hypothetical protein
MAELLDISVLNDISAFWPQSEQIKSHIQGIESHFAANKHACLDSAKCLLESVCKTIIHENGQKVSSDKIPLNRLFSEAMEALGIVRKEAGDIETELFNALIKSIEQVGRFRNHYSANGHGRIANCENLADDMCMMAISTLLSGCLVLFREHHNQSNTHSDVRHSLRPYEAFTPHNDAVDGNTLAEVDAEEAEIVFNGSIRFRYSEILFALDREAYADIITSIGEAA